MSLAIGISPLSPFFTRLAGGVAIPPFYSDLTFDFWNREPGTLVLDERISGDDASIVGGVVADFAGAEYFNYPNSSDIEQFSFYFYTPVEITSLTSSNWWGSLDVNTFGIGFGQLGGNLTDETFSIFKQNNPTPIATYIRDNIPAGNNKIELIWNVSKYDIYLNDVLLQTYTPVGGHTPIMKGNIYIGKSESLAVYYTGEISNVYVNGNFNFPLNGNFYNTLDKSLATNNGVTFKPVTAYTPPSTQTALDNGYYEDLSGNQIINPQYAQTTETLFEGGKMHNFVSSYVEFPVSPIFDRSNTLIYTQTARDSGYYDTLRPTLFHVSELEKYVLDTYINIDYHYLLFVAFKVDYCDKDYMSEIFSYTTQKTGLDLYSVYDYTGVNCGIIPFQSNAAFDFYNRAAGTLVLDERISGDDAAVLGGVVGDFDGASWMIDDSGYDLGVKSFTISHIFTSVTDNWRLYNTRGNGVAGSVRGLQIGTTTAMNWNNIVIDDGLGNFIQSSLIPYIENDGLLHSIIISWDTTTGTMKFYIDGLLKETQTNANLIGVNLGNQEARIGADSIGSQVFTGELSDISIYDGVYTPNTLPSDFGLRYYMNNAYESKSGITAINNGVEFKNVTNSTPPSTLEALDNGYYQDLSGNQIINPQYITPNFEGGKMHNLISSYICLNPTGSSDTKFDLVDRANQTAASTDSVYYDSTSRITRSTYHISEISDARVYMSYFATGDAGKLFGRVLTDGMDILALEEISIYANDKTLSDEWSVINYNKLTPFVAYDEITGEPLYDEETGYIILDTTDANIIAKNASAIHADAQIARIVADGGEIIDEEFIKDTLYVVYKEGLEDSTKLLADANFAVKKDISGAVSVLYDISGNNNDAVQATGANQPIWTAAQQGGKSGLLFTALNSHYLDSTSLLSSLNGTTKGTLIATYKPTTLPIVGNILSFGDTNDNYFMRIIHNVDGDFGGNAYFNTAYKWLNYTDPVFSNGVTKLTSLTQDGTSPVLHLNGSAVTQSFITYTDKTFWFNDYTTLDNSRIGCFNKDSGGNTDFINGALMNTIVFSYSLTTNQRQALEKVINDYYAIY